MEEQGNAKPIDLDKTTVTLEPEKASTGGLYLPGKDRVVFRPPERKSLLGLDVLANAKRAESKVDGGFKVPRDRVSSIVASMGEEENNGSTITDDTGSDAFSGKRNPASRRYREVAVNETPSRDSTLTGEEQVREHKHSEGSQSIRSRTPRYERDDRDSEKKEYRDKRDDHGRDYKARYNRDDRRSERRDYRDDRTDNRRVRHGHGNDDNYQSYGREIRERYEQGYGGDYGRKRSRHDSSKRGSGRSDWDDGKWEWEDTPRRDGNSNSSRRHQPSPSPMLLGASPDVRLVSPWSGGHTPYSSGGGNASAWDFAAPSPVPIRASGSSVRTSSSRHSGKSHQPTFSTETSRSYEDEEMGNNDSVEEHKHEITESMRLEAFIWLLGKLPLNLISIQPGKTTVEFPFLITFQSPSELLLSSSSHVCCPEVCPPLELLSSNFLTTGVHFR